MDRKEISKIVFWPDFFEIDRLFGLNWHTHLGQSEMNKHTQLEPIFLKFFFFSNSFVDVAWIIHDMEMFSALLALYKGNPPPGYSPHKIPEIRSLKDSFVVRLNELFNKQFSHCWFILRRHDAHGRIDTLMPKPSFCRQNFLMLFFNENHCVLI